MITGGVNSDGLAPKTINAILSVLKCIFKYVQRENGVIIAEISDVYVKQEQKPIRILSYAEQQRLTRVLYSELSPCYLGILICLYMGLRLGEICALKWEDICIPEQYICVRHTMQRVQIPDDENKKTKVVIQPPKSSCAYRKIPIPNVLYEYLNAAQKTGEAFVLTGLIDKYLEPRNLENRLKSVATECDIRGITFHTLRHTFATRCVELGFDIKSLSEILGHSTVNITMNRYVHPSMELKQRNMNMISDILSSGINF